jgi:hypothetical protein
MTMNWGVVATSLTCLVRELTPAAASVLTIYLLALQSSTRLSRANPQLTRRKYNFTHLGVRYSSLRKAFPVGENAEG